MILNPAHVEWQKRLYQSLNIGGTWTIPATGTIVKKISEDTVEIITPGLLGPRQMKMVKDVIEHSKAAGYNVIAPMTDFGGGKTVR